MPKWCNDNMLDAALNYVRSNCDRQIACSASPTTYTQATSTYALADVEMTVDTDYTLANGDVNGRKITVASKSGAVDVTGSATHIALVETTGSTLRYITTCDTLGLTVGNTVEFPAWDIEISDPF